MRAMCVHSTHCLPATFVLVLSGSRGVVSLLRRLVRVDVEAVLLTVGRRRPPRVARFFAGALCWDALGCVGVCCVVLCCVVHIVLLCCVVLCCVVLCCVVSCPPPPEIPVHVFFY